ncbi:hypothetical protein SLEP1_g36807 [Rubroshorea leprosula]|uniref:Germin-like protein n=1 Tax=Rubroshorea leprosula TaxID=152421 RepID=A0AAV5KT77_9ROSI|nr:hypothetical protein SLEP1_g36807 [Rubroshorea leprosula]
MKSAYFPVAFVLLAFASSFASAYDPSPLQDFCVAINDTKTGVFVNGKFCKDPKLVVASDFFRSGFDKPRNTSNAVGSAVTQAFVEQFPGLNNLVVQEGTLFVGFVSSNQDGNHLFTKVLNKGDVFVFPIGLIHFQLNIGETPAVAFSGLSSQNPGTIIIANSVFKSNPPINPDVLTKAFMLDKNVIKYLQSHL